MSLVVSKVGAPRNELPTFVTHLGSYAFWVCGPGMVWDSFSQIRKEPNDDEREHTMGIFNRHYHCL